MPAPSWPSVSGSPKVYRSAGRLMKYSSEWQTPAAVTRIRTSPGPGSGVGISRISGGIPIAVYCRALTAVSLERTPSDRGEEFRPDGDARTSCA